MLVKVQIYSNQNELREIDLAEGQTIIQQFHTQLDGIGKETIAIVDDAGKPVHVTLFRRIHDMIVSSKEIAPVFVVG